jgi:hypothetical protein
VPSHSRHQTTHTSFLSIRIARIDSATHATLDMVGGSGGTPTFGLWQRNCVGLRVEQAVNWSAAEGAVQYIADADYLNTGSPA